MGAALTQKVRSRITVGAGALLVSALILSQLPAPAGTVGRDATLIAASILAGFPIAVRAWGALRARAFSIDLLVTIAVVGALVIGEYTESAVVAFLFLFGAWLEARSLERTRASLRELVDLAPTRATVVRDGERVLVDADDVQVGEAVIVTSGERIAVDGVITAGSARIAEASITGEPTPIRKEQGQRVFAGTVVETGYLEIEAEEVGEATTFARIIELVEEAQDSRSRRQRFLERFAQFYTPAIIVGAVIAFAWTRDLGFALTFLVIACPGALVISVPVAAVAGMGNIARHGVLVKDAEALESLAAAEILVVDKTGTLTVGRPVVTGIHAEGDLPESELLALVASLESTSEHHLGRAIVAEARARALPLDAELSSIEVFPGLGLRGSVGGREMLVGRADLLRSHDVTPGEIGESLESAGVTAVQVAVDGQFEGVITVADSVRPGAREALAQLRDSGVRRIIMLTGDNEHAARAVAAELGIDEVRAGLLPADKARIVGELATKGHSVMMVGDGINDAPALATAEVGVAMGGVGMDISMETADVVILTDRLDHLAHARKVTRASVRIMKQNTVISLATVAILIAAVLAHVVQLAGGMLVHEISVLLVILNALRLVRLGASGSADEDRAGNALGPMMKEEPVR